MNLNHQDMMMQSFFGWSRFPRKWYTPDFSNSSVAFIQLIRVTSCRIPVVVPINQVWVAAVVKSTFIIIMASLTNPN